jgi:hypothetical protein
MRASIESVRPSLASGPDAEVVDEFLHRPPLRRPVSAPAGVDRATVGHLAYSLLPAWARHLDGHRAYPQWRATAQLRALRPATFTVPPRLRWNLPTTAGHILDAITQLGPIACPSARKMPPP